MNFLENKIYIYIIVTCDWKKQKEKIFHRLVYSVMFVVINEITTCSVKLTCWSDEQNIENYDDDNVAKFANLSSFLNYHSWRNFQIIINIKDFLM